MEIIWDPGTHDTTTYQIFAKVLLWAGSPLLGPQVRIEQWSQHGPYLPGLCWRQAGKGQGT